MKKISLACLSFVPLIIVGVGCSEGQEIKNNFCAMPGYTLDKIEENCNSLKSFVEYTEDGEFTSYKVTSGKFSAIVELEEGKVDIVRFKENPVPIPNVRIGERYVEVRKRFPNMALISEMGEIGTIALADEEDGIYIAFDTSKISDDWYFKYPLDEGALLEMPVVSINLVASKNNIYK